MKPIVRIAETKTPDGESIYLRQHDKDYAIAVDGRELMSSRQHESELELARLGCTRMAQHRNPVVLIGGLGMGYTLRETLDLLQPGAKVIVAELIPDIVKWNRNIFGELTDHPLRDKRVSVHIGDVAALIKNSPDTFDAILLDVDNGPDAIVMAKNDSLYTTAGINNCMNALHHKGVLSIWSNMRETAFERLIERMRLHIHFFKVPAYKGGKALSRCIWTISRELKSLPVFTPSPKNKRRNKETKAE